MLCILWDIDGTLMSSQGAGTKAMNDAFQACFGIPDAFEDVAMSGCTDPWIFRQGYERHRISEAFPTAMEKFDREYRKALPGRLATSKITLKPGLPALLDVLSKRDDIGSGLLTGNFDHGAETKLRAAGIWHYFATGAYGSDDEDRNKLLPHALRRFRERGREFHPHRTIVIGDTTRDVACARAHGEGGGSGDGGSPDGRVAGVRSGPGAAKPGGPGAADGVSGEDDGGGSAGVARRIRGRFRVIRFHPRILLRLMERHLNGKGIRG